MMRSCAEPTVGNLRGASRFSVPATLVRTSTLPAITFGAGLSSRARTPIITILKVETCVVHKQGTASAILAANPLLCLNSRHTVWENCPETVGPDCLNRNEQS